MSYDSTTMEGAAPELQARAAIGYMLKRISEDPALGWFLNHTEAWARLCQAFASLTGRPVSDVRESSLCCVCKDPREEGRQEAVAAAKQGSGERSRFADTDDDDLSLTSRQVLRVIEDWSMVDRQELLEELLHDYCRACGSRTFIKPCGCVPARRLGVRA